MYEGEYHVPGYNFLGPGTNLKHRKFQAPVNKLNAAAKIHDLQYTDPTKDTWESDKEFIDKALREGPTTGILAAGAVAAKHYLRLDTTFWSEHTNNISGHDTINVKHTKTMADNTSEPPTSNAPSNGWQGTQIGQSTQMPAHTPNFMRKFTVKRTFRHGIKTTQMNQAKVNFKVPRYGRRLPQCRT